MIILVNHKISDPATFWKAAQDNLPNLPEAGVNRILQALPDASMTTATCLWDAENIEILDAYLRSKVGTTSVDTYYEVNTANAMGLPA